MFRPISIFNYLNKAPYKIRAPKRLGSGSAHYK